MERIPPESIAAKHIIAMEVLYRSDRGIGRSYSIRATKLGGHRTRAGAEARTR